MVYSLKKKNFLNYEPFTLCEANLLARQQNILYMLTAF